MNTRLGLLIGLSAILAVGAACAADMTAQVKARKDFFHGIGSSMKGISDALKTPAPSTADIQKYAAALDAQAPKLPTFFPAGSGPESGVKTGAKPEIWQKPAEFKADAAAMAAAAHKLNITAQSGDLAAMKAATSELGAACKSCHESFRSKDN